MLLGLARLPLLRALQLVLRRLPRQPTLIAMGAPLDRFADNAAYLYVHLSQNETAFRAVWVSGSPEVVRRLRARGYRAELRWSRQGILVALRAGTYVYSGYRSDVNGWLCAGALTVSLWHGIPIKRIERAVVPVPQGGPLLRRLAEAGREPPPDVLLSTSGFVTETCFAPAFGVPAARCWELGYPRTDHLLAGPSRPPAALVWDRVAWERLRGARRVVGLFLTWRDSRADDVADEELVRLLTRTCARHDTVLAYKAHFNVAATAAPSECVVLAPDADLNAYLGLCDVLVTDYSSVALDFLLLRRPILYFMPDVAEYAGSRGFTIDPRSLPGTITHDPESLLAALDRLLGSRTGWTPGNSGDRFLEQMWNGYRGHASESIVAALGSTLQIDRPAGPFSEGRRARPAS